MEFSELQSRLILPRVKKGGGRKEGQAPARGEGMVGRKFVDSREEERLEP